MENAISADTLVELFDPETHIYNALGVMLLRPRRVVFIVPEHTFAVSCKYRDAYRRLWRSRGVVPEETVFVPTDTSDMMALADIIDEFSGESSVLDIEGGTPELYIAAGFVYGRSPGKFSCVRIDFSDMKITEYSKNGKPEETTRRPFTPEERARVSLSVDECISIYGGVIYSSTISELTARGMTKKEIANDASAVWRAMLRRSRKTWNSVIPDRIHCKSESSLDIYVNGNEYRLRAVSNLIEDLVSARLLTPRGGDPSRRWFRCRSYAVLFCMRKAGELLELYINSVADTVSGNGAICGVSLGFEGEEGGSDNEIDCIFTRGPVPVFVSCKNGKFGSEELYKFAAVTRQFGGSERVAVLVAPALGDGGGADGCMLPQKIKALRERAELYGINLITDVYGITASEAASELARATGSKNKKACERKSDASDDKT